jgi:hypothetical protein
VNVARSNLPRSTRTAESKVDGNVAINFSLTTRYNNDMTKLALQQQRDKQVSNSIASGEIQRALAELQVAPESVEHILGVLSVVLDARAGSVEEQRAELLKAMMLHGIDPVPSASVAQAQRLARQRERLLASGAYSMKVLAALRGDDKLGTTRTWVARKRANQQMITVNYDGEVFAPVFQFTEEGELQSGVGEVLAVLEPVDLGAWATWSWFESASTWLGGQSPRSVLQIEVQRVVRAAQRFVSNAGVDVSAVG